MQLRKRIISVQPFGPTGPAGHICGQCGAAVVGLYVAAVVGATVDGYV